MNTADELDAFFERVPEHVLTVVDQAYFEYIDRPDYPDAVERYVKAGQARRRPAHVLEDLRARRAARRLRGRAAPTSAPRWRRCGGRSTSRRPAQVAASASIDDDAEIARRREVNAAGLERLEAILRGHGLRARRRPSATSSTSRRAADGDGALRPAAARGDHRAAARRLRRADRDPRLRRHPGGARRVRGRARARARARVTYTADTPGAARPPGGSPPRRLPAALLRHPRLRHRHLDGADRPHGRRRTTARTRRGGSARSSSSRSCRRSSSGSSPGRSSTASRASG